MKCFSCHETFNNVNRRPGYDGRKYKILLTIKKHCTHLWKISLPSLWLIVAKHAAIIQLMGRIKAAQQC